jgi:hypothetical protein
LERKFCRAASGSEYFVFNSNNEFVECLNRKAKVGDKMNVWMICDGYANDNALAIGKYADDAGRVLERGAY